MNQILLFFLFFLLSCEKQGTEGGEGGNFGLDPENPEVSVPGGEDPLAQFAWHLRNTGQSSFAANPGVRGEDLKVLDVHEMNVTGKGIRIAVSDSGTEVQHPDLADNQLVGEHRSYYGHPSTWYGADPKPIGGNAHGTSVTGLIAALGWNGLGSRGVAPDAKFAAFYFIGNFGDNTASYEARTLDQISGDFDIFNYSYGYAGCSFFDASSSLFQAYKHGVTNGRNGRGTIYVKAAGNEFKGSNRDCYSNDSSTFYGNANTGEDQNHPYLVVVGAVNARGEVTSYSSPGSNLWVSSAGGEFGDENPAMITTDISGCHAGFSSSSMNISDFNAGNHSLNPYCNYTNIMNGTSSAAPTLSGIVALMLEANPDLSWRDVKHILAVTADPIKFSTSAMSHPGGANLSGHAYDYRYTVNAAGIKHSNTYGFGRANALRAVQMAKSYVSTLGTYKETETGGQWDYRSGILNLSIPDNSATGVRHGMNVTHALKVESVQIKVNINHPFIGNLGVELTSPSGTVSKILLVNSNIKDRGLYDYTLLTNAFYGEASRGTWSIKVVDGARNNTGSLESWELKINGAQ